MLVDKDKLARAKEAIGDKTPFLIADLLGLEEFDEHNLKALCPFHKEDTPSFIYNPKSMNYHCFGCGRNVSLIDAYIETGDTFLGAAEKVFELAGMTVGLGERGVQTHRNYRYPREEPVRERDKVDPYCAARKISKETLDYCDVRQDEYGNMVFNYYDANDVLTMVKYRPSHKVDKSKGEIKSWCQKGADTKPLLFNMNRINTEHPLLICEGELDSMAAIEAGFRNTVSIPLGAQNHHWIEENWDWLDQFNEIIICADNDEAGQKMVSDVVPRLGAWRTKVVNIPLRVINTANGRERDIKDLNELLYCQGKEVVMDAIMNAADSPIQSVKDLSDVEDINIADLDGIYFGIDELDKELFKLFYGTLTLVTGKPGCVSGDTEFFTGDGWKRIDQYEPGDLVLQYNHDGTAELVKPDYYHKYPCDEFWDIKSKDGSVNQRVSDEHRLVYASRTGIPLRRSVLEILDLQRQNVQGFKEEFITTFDYRGDGIDLSDEQLRVLCVALCYGELIGEKKDHIVRVQITHRGSKYRLRLLLEEAGLEWFEHTYNDESGTTTFSFKIPNELWVPLNTLYHCSHDQLKVMAREFRIWVTESSDDAEAYYRYFYTDNKPLADLLQFALCSIGDRCVVSDNDDSDHTSKFKVSFTPGVARARIGGSPYCRREFDRVPSEDGYKYCFTVYSGMLVLRRDGVINVTGNSGKTSFLYQLVCNTLEQGRSAWVFSRELPEYMSKSWLNHLLAGPRHVERSVGKSDSVYYRVSQEAKNGINDCYRGQWFIYKDEWSNDVDALQESMEMSVRKCGTKFFLIDNLLTVNLHTTEENKYDKQTEFVNWLIQFASRFNVCVILVAHPRKLQNTNAAVDLYDIGGSSNLVNLAHRTLALRRVTPDEKQSGSSKFSRYDCVASVTKDRMRGRSGFELGMYYDEASRRFFTGYEEYDRHYRWDRSAYRDRIPCPVVDMEDEVYGVAAPAYTGGE